VFPFQASVSTEVVDGAIFRRGHEPRARILRHTGHCSSAATRASCAKSSANPISRTILVRLTISRGDSILQTTSMVG
jgi:hypothetical protein